MRGRITKCRAIYTMKIIDGPSGNALIGCKKTAQECFDYFHKHEPHLAIEVNISNQEEQQNEQRTK